MDNQQITKREKDKERDRNSKQSEFERKLVNSQKKQWKTRGKWERKLELELKFFLAAQHAAKQRIVATKTLEENAKKRKNEKKIKTI